MKKHRNLGFGKSIRSSIFSSVFTINVSLYVYFYHEKLRTFAIAFFIISVVALVYYLFKWYQYSKTEDK